MWMSSKKDRPTDRVKIYARVCTRRTIYSDKQALQPEARPGPAHSLTTRPITARQSPNRNRQSSQNNPGNLRLIPVPVVPNCWTSFCRPFARLALMTQLSARSTFNGALDAALRW